MLLGSYVNRGGQKWVYSGLYGKRHAGYDYYNSFIYSKECHNVTVTLLLPIPVQCVS